MAQFRLGTEQALEQADILNHPDITLIQALAIYLSVLQNTGETKLAWFLAGVLVRIAVSMNLHLDGSKLDNISTFEVEMRRRLWWQICLIDSRSEHSQVSTFKMSQHMFDTKLPTNNNDVNLDPSMTHPPVNIEGWTDVTPFLLRCEICMLSHRLQAMGPAIVNVNERHELFMRTESRLRTTYLSHNDDTHRLQSFFVTSVCFFFTKVKLLLPSQRFDSDGVPPGPEPASIFASQMLLVENTFRLQNEAAWKGYRWQLRERHPPWNALRFVLEHLRAEKDWRASSDRALRSVKTSLETVSQAARNDPRYQQLLLLLTMAEKKAEESRHRGDGSSSADAIFPDGPTAEEEANLSVQLAQHRINGEVSYESSQELFLDAVASDGIEMDWQVWDEIAGDLEFWDMNIL
jgi:transcription factor-like protein